MECSLEWIGSLQKVLLWSMGTLSQGWTQRVWVLPCLSLPSYPSSSFYFLQSLSLQSSSFILPALLASLFSFCISPLVCFSLPFQCNIDWHEPISKSLISTKPQGTHCLQQFSCLTQSCRAVRTHNDREEWNPWWVLNIINISWRWIWYPVLNIPIIATLLSFNFSELNYNPADPLN